MSLLRRNALQLTGALGESSILKTTSPVFELFPTEKYKLLNAYGTTGLRNLRSRRPYGPGLLMTNLTRRQN